MVPKDYVGNVIALCVEKRGIQKDMNLSVSGALADLPMSEVVMDFLIDQISQPVASLDCLFASRRRH